MANFIRREDFDGYDEEDVEKFLSCQTCDDFDNDEESETSEE